MLMRQPLLLSSVQSEEGSPFEMSSIHSPRQMLPDPLSLNLHDKTALHEED